MNKIKRKLLLRSSGREANANEDRDLNASSAGVRGSTYSGSTYCDSTYSGSTLNGGQADEGSGPWGLKELCPGRDPIVE